MVAPFVLARMTSATAPRQSASVWACCALWAWSCSSTVSYTSCLIDTKAAGPSRPVVTDVNSTTLPSILYLLPSVNDLLIKHIILVAAEYTDARFQVVVDARISM